MLTPTQQKAREGKITASAVACLMTGDEEKILNLWCELVGDPEYKPVDLSGVWPVQLGSFTEPLNLDWYERKRGREVSRRGEVITHKQIPWAACTLDGWDAELSAPIECKHVGGREALATIIERYQPQVQWQMIVTGAKICLLSVIEGANEPVIEEIPFDEDYATELMTRAKAFMRCVETLTPPVDLKLAPVAAPVKAEKAYDMQSNNAWASSAFAWLETKDAAKKAKDSEKALKELVPADAKRCFGHGIEISRNRAGSLSLKVSKE